MNTIKDIIEVLRKRLDEPEIFLSEHREITGNVLAGAFCESIPPEVALAAGISIFYIPVKYQLAVMKKSRDIDSSIDWINSNYDLVLVPSCLDNINKELEDRGIEVYSFKISEGWGEESSVFLHNEILSLFESTGYPFDPLQSVNKLRESCKVHDSIRKLVRGIAATRADNPKLLSNNDLQVVFESALCLPPESMVEELSSLLSLLQDKHSEHGTDLNVMVFGGMELDGRVLDDIELTGSLVITEDDCCMARRRFDMSLNCQSPNLYYELLDLYSYKPYCPMMRPVEERYQLLYKLLKNYNINLLLFIEDALCHARNEHSRYLYRKVRQDGIDALVTTEKNAVNDLRDYIERYNSGMRVSISIPEKN